MSNTVASIRKLFERALEQQHGMAFPPESPLWSALGLYLVADALQTISTSVDNLGSEVRDCNDGVAQALGEMEVTISKIVDELRALPEKG